MPDVNEVASAFPTAELDHDNLAYHAGILRRRLVLDRCGSCRRWHHPPRALCPHCWSTDVTQEEVAGHGVVVLAFGLPAPDGFTTVVTAELDEDKELRYTTRLIGDVAVTTDLIGRRVALMWGDPDGVPEPLFQLTEGKGADR